MAKRGLRFQWGGGLKSIMATPSMTKKLLVTTHYVYPPAPRQCYGRTERRRTDRAKPLRRGGGGGQV